jgi:hypothetical protein
MGRTDETAAELIDFRRSFHQSLPRWGDALFELCDAALCSSAPVGSVPSLSLEPEFRRSHGSLYKSLAGGGVDEVRFRQALVEHRPKEWSLVFAVDASTWDRCDAECSPERGFYYSASKHSAGQPIVAGWSYQWICQLGWAYDSWTAPLDVERIPPRHDAANATTEQIRRLVGLLPDDGEVPLFVFDAGYNPIAVGHQLAEDRCECLTRIRDDRVFYADPPARPNRPAKTGGRPPRHGRRFKCSDRNTWARASASLVSSDPRYGTVRVTAWHGLHPRVIGRGRWAEHDGAPPIVRGTVIRIEVEHLPKPTSQTKKTLWLFWSGPTEPDLERCWRAYLRRFDIEHTFRFIKNTMGWTTPSLCTPDQADRWTWLMVSALTQLRLARGLVDDLRLPWERRSDPKKLTPVRVRRGFRQLRAMIGTPASPPKSTTAGPGRPKGTRKPPRIRYPPVKKAA